MEDVEGGVAGAEIVDRHPESGLPIPADKLHEVVEILDRLAFSDLEDERRLAYVFETRAAIALARNDAEPALALVERGLELARRTGDRKAELSNLLRRAKVRLALGDQDGALASYEEAATLARTEPGTPALRRVLADWAELLAQTGHVERAYELAREALAR